MTFNSIEIWWCTITSLLRRSFVVNIKKKDTWYKKQNNEYDVLTGIYINTRFAHHNNCQEKPQKIYWINQKKWEVKQ